MARDHNIWCSFSLLGPKTTTIWHEVSVLWPLHCSGITCDLRAYIQIITGKNSLLPHYSKVLFRMLLFIVARYHIGYGKERLFIVWCNYSLMGLKTTTAIIHCGQRSQHLWRQREAIHCLMQLQFDGPKDHNYMIVWLRFGRCSPHSDADSSPINGQY